MYWSSRIRTRTFLEDNSYRNEAAPVDAPQFEVVVSGECEQCLVALTQRQHVDRMHMRVHVPDLGGT